MIALGLSALAQEALAVMVGPSEELTSCCPAPRPGCGELRQISCRSRVCSPRPYRSRVSCPRPCRVRVCKPKRVYCPRIRCCRPKPVCCAPVVPPCEAAPCVNPTPDMVCSRSACTTPCGTSASAISEDINDDYSQQEVAPAYSAPNDDFEESSRDDQEDARENGEAEGTDTFEDEENNNEEVNQEGTPA